MSNEDKDFLNTIMAYAEKVMPDIDPQKVRVSEQIEKLRPILQELAMKNQMSVEEVFIKYMDLATEHALKYNMELQENFKDAFDPKF